MGYRTYFTFIVPEENKVLIQALQNFSETASYCIDADGSPTQDDNWTEYEEEMKEFSSIFPDVVLRMDCEDTEGNRWIDYFKNGKHQCCPAIVTYEEYNEDKLK